jgi:hypothetical protein
VNAPAQTEPPKVLTYEHHHALVQVLGKKRARTFYMEVGRRHPCTYCGAKIGEQCVTDAGLRTECYQHKARRDASHDEATREIWELTREIVATRKANEEATLPVSMPSAVPRVRLRPKIELALSSDPIGVRLGLAVARVQAARERDERAWRELGEAIEDLADAEESLREIAGSLGLTDVEALMRAGEARADD